MLANCIEKNIDDAIAKKKKRRTFLGELRSDCSQIDESNSLRL